MDDEAGRISKESVSVQQCAEFVQRLLVSVKGCERMNR